MLSASNADRVVACPASDVLPQIREENEAAEKGTIIHEFLQGLTMFPGEREQLLARVPDAHREYCRRLDITPVLNGLTVVGVEMAYALNVASQTVRFIGSNIGRNYGRLDRYEVPCTLDVEAIRTDGTPVELDWKTGRFMDEIENRWQRRICATAMILKHGTSEAGSANVYTRDDGGLYPDRCDFSIVDALGFCAELKSAIDRRDYAAEVITAGRVPDVYPNTEKQCKYCPARDACPATTALVRSFTRELATTDMLAAIEVATPEEQGFALGRVKQFASLAEVIEKRLKAIAKERALPAGDGYEWRACEKSREYFDADAARGLLVSLGATPEQVANLNKKTHYKEVRRLKVVR